MTPQTTMTKAEFARHRDVSDSYVSKLARQGRLVLDARGLVLVEASIALMESVRDPGRGGDRSAPTSQAAPAVETAAVSQPPAGGHPGNALTYNEAARREKIAKARTAELEQGEAARQLVRRDAVERVVFGLARTAMEALRNVAPRIAGQLATETDARRCEQIVEAELAAVCQAMAKASLDDETADAEDR